MAVVGLGALGSAALWRLAQRGVTVVGFEQFPIGHALGSTHGHTRLFREACLEHPSLVPMAQLSKDLFRDLEAATGETLLTVSGGLMVGDPRSEVVSGTLAAADAHGLPYERYDAEDLRRRFPQHEGIRETDVGVFDPGAGIARPERTVRASIAEAKRLGARVLESARVLNTETTAHAVTVHTAESTWQVDQVVLATGAWLASEVPGMSLRPIRSPMFWFRPRGDEDAFDLPAFPVFVRQVDDAHVLWGHGSVDGGLVKAGLGDLWDSHPTLDPDRMDRGVGSDDWREVSQVVEGALPGLRPEPARVDPCMVTISPDGQFVVGKAPDSPRTLLAGGDSGHAFKHAPAIGEVIARQIVGEDIGLDVDFLRSDRFAA